MILLIFQKTVT
nr:unnamed protein product [Callosobruchus analis]